VCLAEVAFFSLVAGMSVVSGFATTVMLAKRRDSEMFDKVLRVHINYFVLFCADIFNWLQFLNQFGCTILLEVIYSLCILVYSE